LNKAGAVNLAVTDVNFTPVEHPEGLALLGRFLIASCKFTYYNVRVFLTYVRYYLTEKG
jgi:hypothetical protein